MDLPFGLSAWQRSRGNLAELPVINMFAETAPAEGRLVLQSRPGLDEYATRGSGPINGLFRRDGVLDGAMCAVSGQTLFVGANAIGNIGGTGSVSFSGDEEELTVNAGAGIYQTDGTTLTEMTFPDNAAVSKILDLAGYNIAIRANTGRIYWRLWGINTWDALDYATAENEPDKLLDGLAIDDYLVLFGTETVEFWPKTGDPDLPFQPTQGRVYEKGIRAKGCCAAFDNSFVWVTSKDQGSAVYRGGNTPERISNPGIEEKIAASESCSVYSFFFEGHEFAAIRLDDRTLLIDAQTRETCEFSSYGRSNFRAKCCVQGPYFGDDDNGTIWRFSDGYVDAGQPMERRFRFGLGLESPVTVDCIRLSVNPGQTGVLSGDYSNPVAELRMSDDLGQTWSDWEQTELGAHGDYRQRTEWRRLGMFDEPGLLGEVRVTDPVPFRVSKVIANPNSGGRAR